MRVGPWLGAWSLALLVAVIVGVGTAGIDRAITPDPPIPLSMLDRSIAAVILATACVLTMGTVTRVRAEFWVYAVPLLTAGKRAVMSWAIGGAGGVALAATVPDWFFGRYECGYFRGAPSLPAGWAFGSLLGLIVGSFFAVLASLVRLSTGWRRA